MNKAPLGQLCSLFSGGTPSTKKPEYWNGDILWLSSAESGNDFIYDSKTKITQSGVDNSATKLAKKNSVIIATAGEGKTRGQTSYLETDAYINQSLIALNTRGEVTNLYLYYYLKNSYQRLRKLSGITGVRGSLSGDLLKDFEIRYPDLNIQNQITHLLRSIDSKIENNNKIISELESIVKTIYDYWFLQFEFPDENGKPYKSSGGKMVWSTELKREIPEDWSIISLDKIANVVTSSITPSQAKTYDHYSIPAYDTSKMPVLESGKDINSNKYLVYENCILVSKLNPHFKRIWNIYSINDNSICSTEFMPFLSINGHKEFLYSVLNSDAFYTFTINNSNSSTGSRKRMQPEAYKDFKLAYPLNDNKVISKFCDVTRGLLKQQDSLIKENQELISLRNFLLPMLMNGQVTFKKEA